MEHASSAPVTAAAHGLAEQLIVTVVFIGVFVGIFLEKVDKAVVVLGGGLLLILLGIIGFEQAMHAIDYNTIVLLLGMMVLVASLQEVHVFDWMSLKLARLTRGNPFLIFTGFGFATAMLSAFLDNVTTVMIIVPLVIALTRGIGLDPRTYVLCMVFLSNIGGAATLVGDPPNILIGSQVEHLTFATFPQYMLVPVVLSGVAVAVYLRQRHTDQIRSRNGMFGWLFMSNLILEQFKRQDAELKIPRSVAVPTLTICGLLLIGFFGHTILHLEPAVVAITGAVLMLAVLRKSVDIHHVMGHVEWTTLLFFAGLFIIVGAMEHVGLLLAISHWLVGITTNVWLLLMIVLWASAILSGIVDNIPFVAVMIPILHQLTDTEPFASDPSTHLVWWALIMGACFGGNATMIGASANVVSCAAARARGIPISFRQFARESVPVTFITIVISSLYLTALYFLERN